MDSLGNHDNIPMLPNWVTSARKDDPEALAVQAGAALSHLCLVLKYDTVPVDLLRARLALTAAESCVGHMGRPERRADLRDALGFLHPGDQPGPAGDVYMAWRRAVERPISLGALERALPHMPADQIAHRWSEVGKNRERLQNPVASAALFFRSVQLDHPREVSAALIFADVSIALAMGWTHMLPLLSLGLKRIDMRKDDEDFRRASYRAVVAGTIEVVRDAATLSGRAARLMKVAPKLRARGADEAVRVFLTQDAVAATDLNMLRSERSARRFCDRLVELEAVRELTGRDTFRLYGL